MIKLLSAASFLLLFTVLPLGSCDLEYPCIQATPSHHTMVLTAIEDASAKIESGLFVDAGRVLDNAWRYVEYELCYSEARERMRSVLKNATIEILAKATIPGKSFISSLVRKNSGQIDAVPLTAADISDLISTLPSILTSKLSATSEDADLNDVYNLLHHVFSSIEALGSYSSKSDLTTRFYAAISQPLRSLTSNQLELLLSFNGFDASFNNTLRSIARACSYAENFDTTSLGHVEETISLATTSAEQGNFANACLLMNTAWDDFSRIDLSVRLSHYSIIKDAAERLYTLADTPCKKWELVFEASAWCAHLPVATISASDFKNELQQRMAFVESEVKNAAGNRAILTFQKMVSALSYIQRNDPASYASILAEYKNVANGVLSRIGSSVDTPIRETFQLKIDSL